MREEVNYTCWFEGETEGQGKNIKAPNLEAAARIAVDIWRHHHLRELGHGAITVYLKNERGEVSKVRVKGQGDEGLRDLSS